MPITYWTYLIGTLALAGIIPFAGFWSKDEILLDALKGGVDEGRLGGYVAFALLLTAAVFTAFYMWRQVSLVFLGEPRHAAAEHAEESGSLMTTPLLILAGLSLLIGLHQRAERLPDPGLAVWGALFTSLAGAQRQLCRMPVRSTCCWRRWRSHWRWWRSALARQVYNDRVLAEIAPDPLEANRSDCARVRAGQCQAVLG